MRKFTKFSEFLKLNNFKSISVSFSEIEKIIGNKLCSSAYKYKTYWNPSGHNNLSNCILKAGYKISRLNLDDRVLFLEKLELLSVNGIKVVTSKKNIEKKIRKGTTNLLIPNPSKESVFYYLKRWDALENYALQERSLDKLFLEVYKENKMIEDILIKVSSLNDFYSTNIYSVFPVAKHILELDIDDRLKVEDLSLVDDISKVVIHNKEKHFYSFATKYCSHHRPDVYPIYDNYVQKVLMYFNKKDNFSTFNLNDLKKYQKFKGILFSFRKFYNLEEFSIKDIDRYIWQLGKDYFPKKY